MSIGDVMEMNYRENIAEDRGGILQEGRIVTEGRPRERSEKRRADEGAIRVCNEFSLWELVVSRPLR